MVTFDIPLQTDIEQYQISWTTDLSPDTAPTYRVYKNDTLVETTAATTALVTVGQNETPYIEVTDTEGDLFLGSYQLYWQGPHSNWRYAVERFTGDGWVEVASVAVSNASNDYFYYSEQVQTFDREYRVCPYAFGVRPFLDPEIRLTPVKLLVFQRSLSFGAAL